MSKPSRRDALKSLGSAGAGLMISGGVIRAQTPAAAIVVSGQAVEIAVTSLSPETARITVRPIPDGVARPVPVTGALVRDEFAVASARAREAAARARVT